NRGWSEPHLVSYMESHDEERLMYKNLTYGNASGDYDITDFSTALRRVEEAAAFFFTVPGPKMIWQFEEVGYDYSIDYNGRTGNKPIRWDYVPWRNRTFAVFQTLIKLRREQPVFNTSDFTMNVAGPFKQIALNDTSMDVCIIGNFDVINQQGDPSFSRTGTWYDYFTGNILEVTDVNTPIELEPGEYHIYTTKPLKTPDLPLSVFTPPSRMQKAEVYPNPAVDKVHIQTQTRMGLIEVYDLSNRLVKRISPGCTDYPLDISGLTGGIYILKIKTLEGFSVCKVVKQ
ncbi:MAG TPA: T9SS type A sorting domain-containing protein, partial [Bacteroidales bacterium]|nr:T9SS type A sorting domain-containing protein [Bacteroidales bacterium]